MPDEYLERVVFDIECESDVLLMRSASSRLAKKWGGTPQQAQEVAIVASELGTNIVKYAAPGCIWLGVLVGSRRVFEVVAEDHGKGIPDVLEALQDLHTGEGPLLTLDGPTRPFREGLGCGLGAVQRLTDGVEITGLPPHGTRVRAIKRLGPPPEVL